MIDVLVVVERNTRNVVSIIDYIKNQKIYFQSLEIKTMERVSDEIQINKEKDNLLQLRLQNPINDEVFNTHCNELNKTLMDYIDDLLHKKYQDSIIDCFTVDRAIHKTNSKILFILQVLFYDQKTLNQRLISRNIKFTGESNCFRDNALRYVQKFEMKAGQEYEFENMDRLEQFMILPRDKLWNVAEYEKDLIIGLLDNGYTRTFRGEIKLIASIENHIKYSKSFMVGFEGWNSFDSRVLPVKFVLCEKLCKLNIVSDSDCTIFVRGIILNTSAVNMENISITDLVNKHGFRSDMIQLDLNYIK